MNYPKIVHINADNIDLSRSGTNLYESRENFYSALYNDDVPEVSIAVVGLNNLDKTKNCIESLIKQTQNIDYELILVDNGSEDGTLSYFEGLDFPKKIVIAMSKNAGLGFAMQQISSTYTGKYLCLLANDLVVTKNWMTNLLSCIKSDDSIGVVNPMSTNVSNYQIPPNFSYTSIDDFVSKAERFNTQDSSKWEQRLRIITLGSLFRRSVLDIVGTFDLGFVHDFSEDDLCLRIRRAGYKIILCGDVVIHHDHSFSNMSPKALERYSASLSSGRLNFQSKYLGLDAWDDVNFYMLNKIDNFPILKCKQPTVLGIDTKMGTPILEMRNLLRRNNIFDVRTIAFTQQAKYFTDLQTVCAENVYCDRIEHIDEYFDENTFDYILFGEPIGQYAFAKELLECLCGLLKPNAILVYKETQDEDYKILRK